MQKGIITGGSWFHQNFFTASGGKYAGYFDRVIYLPYLKYEEISSIDLLVVASHLNPDLLVECSNKLLTFLEQGGNIVLFGEYPKRFLPFIRWKASDRSLCWWMCQGVDLPMFAVDDEHSFWRFVRIEQCKWCYHGTFSPCKRSCNILVNEIGESIIYKDSHHFKGTMYITSLDPDYHIAQGFMHMAEDFFDNFLSWVVEDIKTSLPPPPPLMLKIEYIVHKQPLGVEDLRHGLNL